MFDHVLQFAQVIGIAGMAGFGAWAVVGLFKKFGPR